jgi:inner membrane protein
MNLRTSVMARLLVMGCLFLGLLIPLTMVQSVVSERATRREAVTQEIGSTWGGPQAIVGLVLTVPYRYQVFENGKRQEDRIARAVFLPETLDVQGNLTPEIRQRTLFKVVVYRTHLQISGRFARPDMARLRPAVAEALWNEATVSLGVSDPRGIASRTTVRLNGRDRPFIPGVDSVGLSSSGMHAGADGLDALAAGAPVEFSMGLDVNGSRDLRFVPAGSDTTVRLTSAWPHPTFAGAPLPDSRRVDGDGFTAVWKVPYFGRGFPPAWVAGAVDGAQLKALSDASQFGVGLIQPVDIYQQSERAIKYAALFIVLTFVVFFLFETIRARLLHPIQYVFVGFAMCVFYLLLVSISEHLGFDVAYASAAAATTLLISTYSFHVLGGLGEGALMGGGLSGLYGFLYLLLRLEDYALLAGSLGLFLMLALLMYLTRRVNWYELRLGGAESRLEG